MKGNYLFLLNFLAVAISVSPISVQAAESQTLECKILQHNKQPVNAENPTVFSRSINDFSVDSSGNNLVYERGLEKLVISRKTGEFELVNGDTGRFARYEATRIAGTCVLKVEKLKF